jgi:hypothetical protein
MDDDSARAEIREGYDLVALLRYMESFRDIRCMTAREYLPLRRRA